MERITSLRNAIVEAMEGYAALLEGANQPGIEYELLFDEKHHKYQLLAVGWDKHERVYYVVFHADIIGGKIWIQEDNTEKGFATLLLEKGISKQDIVLAYYPDFHRKYTEFAVM